MWENPTAHQLKDGEASLDAADRWQTARRFNRAVLMKAGKDFSTQNFSFLIFPTSRRAYAAH